MAPKRVGIVGYGHLGKFLTKAVQERPDLELAFVWNRTFSVLDGEVESRYICENLENCSQFSPDLIVEVSHPVISEKYGPMFLNTADYLVGSPTALASQPVEDALRTAATSHGLYVPAGAFWGAEDILKMADRGTLKGLKVTMKKHPSCFKFEGELKAKNEQICGTDAVTLYDGPVRGLCPLAPNNVNTMAAAAMAGHNLGFDVVQGCLVSDPKRMAGAVPSNTRRFLASSFANASPSCARHHALRSQDSRWRTTGAWILGFVGRRPCSSSSRQSTPESFIAGSCPRRELHQEFGDSDHVRPYESIPGPKPLPLLGNKLLFTPLGGYSLERYWESCWKLYDLYGPIVRLAKLSSQFDMVLVFRPEDTRRIFEKEGRLPVRPALDILEYYRMRNPDLYSSPGIVPGNGEEWKRLRVCVHSLLRRELVQRYKAAQASVAQDLATALDDAQRHHPEGPVPDLLHLLFRYTLEAVGVVSLGTRLGCLDAAHATTHAQTRARDVIAANEETLAVMGASLFSPPLYRVLPTRAYNALSRAQFTISSVVEEQLRRRREEHAQDPIAFKEQHPFLSSLFERQDIAPSDVFLLVVEVFQGGIDATATTLGFCLHYLSREKGTQETLFNEVKDVDPATHTLQGLSYLRAVVQEAMRLRPSAGGRTRVIHEAGVFCGFHVPAGTCVSSPPVIACFDPEVFPEPHQFRPERWLSRTKLTQAASSHPTGGGGRGVGSATGGGGEGRGGGSVTGMGSATPMGGGGGGGGEGGSVTGIGVTTPTGGEGGGSATGIGSAPPTGGEGGGSATGIGSTPPTPAEEKRIHPYTILPFGHGARMCPGRRVAEQEIYLALIQVVKAFRMECVGSPGGSEEPIGQVLRLNMMPDAPIAIRFTRR